MQNYSLYPSIKKWNHIAYNYVGSIVTPASVSQRARHVLFRFCSWQVSIPNKVNPMIDLTGLIGEQSPIKSKFPSQKTSTCNVRNNVSRLMERSNWYPLVKLLNYTTGLIMLGPFYRHSAQSIGKMRFWFLSDRLVQSMILWPRDPTCKTNDGKWRKGVPWWMLENRYLPVYQLQWLTRYYCQQLETLGPVAALLIIMKCKH